MGQFAAVIVPQYCGAPAEKLGVLEWAIALKVLEVAEQSHPFAGHPGVAGALLPAGGSHRIPGLHLGAGFKLKGCLSPNLPGWPSIESPVRKGEDTRSCAPRSSRLCPAWSLSWPLLSRAARGCFDHFSVLVRTRDWEPISGHCPGMKSFMEQCKVTA